MDEELKSTVLKVLTRISPEVDAAKVEPEVNFRDQFDFDSLDFLNFAIGLREATGIAIPDTDYPRLTSLGSSIRYLKEVKPSYSPAV